MELGLRVGSLSLWPPLGRPTESVLKGTPSFEFRGFSAYLSLLNRFLRVFHFAGL